jgi:hypothetical protein
MYNIIKYLIKKREECEEIDIDWQIRTGIALSLLSARVFQ